jgi:hypothetical protein
MININQLIVQSLILGIAISLYYISIYFSPNSFDAQIAEADDLDLNEFVGRAEKESVTR